MRLYILLLLCLTSMENSNNQGPAYDKNGIPLNPAAQAEQAQDMARRLVQLESELRKEGRHSRRRDDRGRRAASSDGSRSPSSSPPPRKKAGKGKKKAKTDDASSKKKAKTDKDAKGKGKAEVSGKDWVRSPELNRSHITYEHLLQLACASGPIQDYRPGMTIYKDQLRGALKIIGKKTQEQWLADNIFTQKEGNPFDLLSLAEFSCLFGATYLKVRESLTATNAVEKIAAHLLLQFDGDIQECDTILEELRKQPKNQEPPSPPPATSVAAAGPPPQDLATVRSEMATLHQQQSNMEKMIAAVLAKINGAQPMDLAPPGSPSGAGMSSAAEITVVEQALNSEWHNITVLTSARKSERQLKKLNKKDIFVNCDATTDMRADYYLKKLLGGPSANTLQAFDEWLVLSVLCELTQPENPLTKNSIIAGPILDELKASLLIAARKVDSFLNQGAATPSMNG